MRLPRRRFLQLAAPALALFACALTNHKARTEPTQRMKIVVPVQPGGVTDIMARLLAAQIGSRQEATAVVENRPGGSTVVGIEDVARAAPDGRTLLFTASTFVIKPQFSKLNYDPPTSFEPICLLASAPTVIVVNAASSYRTLGDLIDAARAKPGALTVASTGPRSNYQLGLEMLKQAAAVDMTFVPYPGNIPAVNAVLGQQVTAMFGTYSNVAPYVKSGQLRPLAAASRSRIEELPNVPTLAEAGYKDIDVDAWFGVFAPAKTPKDIVARLVGWFTDAAAAPEVKAKFVAQGLYPAATCGADFNSFLRQQYENYGRIIREAKINGD